MHGLQTFENGYFKIKCHGGKQNSNIMFNDSLSKISAGNSGLHSKIKEYSGFNKTFDFKKHEVSGKISKDAEN